MSWLRSKPSARVGARREQLEHAPGAGAEIDQQREGTGTERLVRPPLRRLPRRHASRGCCPTRRRARGNSFVPRPRPRLLDRQSAGAVALEDGIGGIEARHDGRGKFGLAASIGEAEEHPAPLAEARDQPSLGHQLQVTADARLALSQDLGQVLDVQFAAGEQRQDAQAASPRPRREARPRPAPWTNFRNEAGLGQHLT